MKTMVDMYSILRFATLLLHFVNTKQTLHFERLQFRGDYKKKQPKFIAAVLKSF